MHSVPKPKDVWKSLTVITLLSQPEVQGAVSLGFKWSGNSQAKPSTMLLLILFIEHKESSFEN